MRKGAAGLHSGVILSSASVLVALLRMSLIKTLSVKADGVFCLVVIAVIIPQKFKKCNRVYKNSSKT